MVSPDNDRDDDCENIGLGCALEHFAEVEEVMTMIDNLKNIYETPELEVEYDKLYNILKQYYEQPHLLDPHLDKILAKFIGMIKDKESPVELKHAIFNYMYQIIRVRGYKVVIRHLPHEVSDLLMVLTFLESQDPKDKETWRTRFVLMLWLSIVVIIPFHMSRLDGFAPGQKEEESKKLTVMERIFNICKTYALSKDTCAEASAFLASKFLTRSDVKDLYMSAFFSWACDLHSNIKDECTIYYGVLAAVAAVLKHGKRDDLLPFAPKLLEWVTTQDYKQHKAMLVRKYGMKIVQRIGLTFLRPRVATWRYTRGSRSLASTLGGAPAAAAAAGDQNPAPQPVDDEDEDIPQEVEDVVELLLCGLRDEDTVVRWSCAKGVGRLGARLPAAAAAEVADSVLALFADNERDTAWHGGCMATAELGRRGLLSPAQLGAAVGAVQRALRRDCARAAGAGGGGGGGRAARDAACHAAWALARAYDAAELRPHAAVLAAALIATACFDREINCRRAASAAYQENVGRHGMFPHGIEVLTAADFQSVGPRAHAYLGVAPQVAAHREYALPLVDHLVDLKLEHWDCAIRELAAKALHNLTDKLPEYVATVVVPRLVEKIDSADLNVRHGAIYAIGEVIDALAKTTLPDGRCAESLVPDEACAAAGEVAERLRARRQLRGLGGELVRAAACHAAARLLARPRCRPPLPDEWFELIEDCLGHEVQSIREKAIEALPVVFEHYLCGGDDPDAAENRALLMDKYCAMLRNTGPNGLLLRMGYARAIGALPKSVLQEHLPKVIDSLIECTKVTEATAKWAESRRDAVLGLSAVCVAVGVEGGAGHLRPAFAAMLACLDEYTVDRRGDVGAWVREASMSGLLALARLWAERPRGVEGEGPGEDAVHEAVARVAQQAVEKIDRTRALAGRVLTAFLHNEPKIEGIPHHEELKAIFPAEEPETKSLVAEEGSGAGGAGATGGGVLWLFPAHTMPRLVRLLDFPPYRYHVLKGLVVSAGELTETLVRHTTAALFAHLQALEGPQLRDICDVIVQIFADNLHVKRITGSIFNFLDRLMSSGAISPVLEDEQSTFAADILKYVGLELAGAKNIYKLLDSINVLCQLVQVGGVVCRRALGRLLVLAAHGERYVRRCAASRLYEALTLYGDVLLNPHLDKAMSILAETDWERDVAELRPIRNEICDLLGIKRPVMKQKAT